MLIDQEGVFMTQRVRPSMALLKLSLKDNEITITHQTPARNDAHPSLTINTLAPLQGNIIRAKIWDDEVDVIEVDRSYSKWFSDRLGMECRLVNFPETQPRPVDVRYSINQEHVSLADAYPFLIIGQASLDNLNTKLTAPLPMNRFRPNFVFTGGEPHAEDSWRNFTIGDTRFVGVKLCARCVLTTINQDTAEKGIEPLATLSKYRKQGNKILFGQNLVALGEGVVHVGDSIILN